MVDVERISKIARRKLQEIKAAIDHAYDADNQLETIRLIASLAKDLEFCYALKGDDLGRVPCSEPIDICGYRNSMVDDDIADEDWFDSIRIKPDDETVIRVLMDELRSCRVHIDDLAASLDSANREIESLKELLAEEGIRMDNQDRMKTELNPLACTSISSFDREMPRLNSTALGELVKIRGMKSMKVEEYRNGIADESIDPQVGESIIEFLTVDIGICDALLGIDFNDRQSVIEGFRNISGLLCNSNEPKHQEEYSLSLNSHESFLEFGFAQILNNVQTMMVSLKSEL